MANARVAMRAKPVIVRVIVDFIFVLPDYDVDGASIIFRFAIESP